MYNFGRQSKNIASVSTEIEVDLARLDLCPLGHTNHTSILNDLGIAYSFYYDQNGNIANLNRSIEFYQRRLFLCPLSHPEHVEAFEPLVMVLHKHYNIQNNKDGLKKLIDIQEAWLNICPSTHPKYTTALGSFATSLQKHYEIWGDIIDLNKAIEIKEKVLELCPLDHPDHDTALNNLAVSLNSRYKKLNNLMDLNRNIDLYEQCLKLRPPGHQHHGVTLQNLASSFLDHYHNIKEHSSLSKANRLFKKALKAYPVHHSDFAFNVSQLAETTLFLSKTNKNLHLPDHLCPSVDEAFDTYRLLKKCGSAASLNLLKATQAWVKDAEKHNHSGTVLEAYHALLEALDHFLFLSPSLDSRYEIIQANMIHAANDGFSCAIRHDNLQMAVELLEKGRGILWNQLAHIDMSMSVLKSWDNQEYELGKKLTTLSVDLRRYAQRSASQGTDPYWQIQEEWQHVVDRIHHLDKFSKFLLPPCFDDLQQATEYGPVIIMNASQYSCDALIVLYTQSPIHMFLHCSLHDIIQLCSQLSNLTQHMYAYGAHRETYVKEILRELWSSIVEPIVGVLQNNVQLPLGSRIWWCPTSKFTFLPFHAAGPYQNGKENLMNIFVSSYAPSLSALLRTCDHIHSNKRKVYDVSGATDVISFAVIGQAHSSTDTSSGQLPGVEHEIQSIQYDTNIPTNIRFKTFIGPAASIENTIHAFQNHQWVHITCPGGQHTENPFNSWLMMNNGKLTLMDIIQEHYIDAEFAFLSTCHTAKGDMSTPNEVLHLAAGMHFAGFNGVIGTLWMVDDATTHHVVAQFYKEMFKYSNIDFKHAAIALNTAIIDTADKVPLEKRIMFVHIGI